MVEKIGKLLRLLGEEGGLLVVAVVRRRRRRKIWKRRMLWR